MKRYFLPAFLLMLFFSRQGWSDSLCTKGEVDYFSCKVAGSGKIISLCGNMGNEDPSPENPSPGKPWLQYRFGRAGQLELVYPKKKQDSVSRFEGHYYGKYGAADVMFINGKVLYYVYLNAESTDEKTGREYPAAGGVGLEFGGGKRTRLGCRKLNLDKYYSRLMDLTASLHEYNGETHFMDDFYKKMSARGARHHPSMPE